MYVCFLMYILYATLEELLILADEYQDLALKEYCEKKVQHGIRIDNVAILYPLALKLNATVSNLI